MVKGDFVPMASVGASQNKILADISNLPQQPKQHISVDHLLKVYRLYMHVYLSLVSHFTDVYFEFVSQEKETLIKLLANRE